MGRFRPLAGFLLAALLVTSCGRFGRKAASAATGPRDVVISQLYNEIIWALGAQQSVVAVDWSSTYPPAIKSVATIGYHRALSAESILSLRPTVVIEDGNVGPPQVLQQLHELGVPTKTFTHTNDTIPDLEALIREMGAFFHKEARAEELCQRLDRQMAASLEAVKQYHDSPRVAIIHYGQASNVYLTVTGHGGGDAAGAGQMIAWAGGRMAIGGRSGMQRLLSPEIVAEANPDVILMTAFGYDKLGSMAAAKTLPGVAETSAARHNRIYRVTEHQLMYLNPDTGANVLTIAKLIHQPPSQ
ncbi:MAG TPA: ABC transporter substrate-binding protein [Vicinamibacterales bacterium]|nr:ABC transporter substrate-binding protein [Vicinamibacterales bacterium]